MKKVIGISSIVVGAFFLSQLLIWGPAYGIEQQSLKWIVAGFGWLFIILGAIAVPEEQTKQKTTTDSQKMIKTENETKEENEELSEQESEQDVQEFPRKPPTFSELRQKSKWK